MCWGACNGAPAQLAGGLGEASASKPAPANRPHVFTFPTIRRGGLERRGKQETKYLKELEAIAESGVTQVGTALLHFQVLRCVPAGLRCGSGRSWGVMEESGGPQAGLRVVWCIALLPGQRAGQHAGAAASTQLFSHAADIAH